MLRYILTLPWSERQRRLAAARPQMAREQFVNYAGTTELGRRAAGLLWDKLQARRVWYTFTPHPDDDLEDVFGLAEEELDEDAILDILKSLQVPIPNDYEIAMIGNVDTPRDIIRLIEASDAAVPRRLAD